MAYDWKTGATGAVTGATQGGSIGGPWGALIGAGVGFSTGFLGGEKNRSKNSQPSTFDPQQKQLYDQKIQALEGNGGPLADVYGQFNPELMRDYYEKSYANPQYQEFQQRTVPTITGQFRGHNLQNSSYLGEALSRAGTDVQNNLNAQLSKLLYEGEQSSLTRRGNALENILNMQTHVNERGGPSIFDNLLNSLAEGSGDILADYLKSRKKTPSTMQETPTNGVDATGSQQPIGG